MNLQSSELRRDHGILIVVKTASLDYRAPARLDDALTLKTLVTKVGGSSMTLTQDVVRGDEPICDMTIVLVCVDAHTGRPVRWPAVVTGAVNSCPGPRA
jgi:acyl-CoA thioester hydrolase